MSFEICNICAEPNKKVNGYIPLVETSIVTYKMPIVIINGSNPGPKICLTAGIHGTEYAGIEAVLRILNNIEPEKLNGIIFAIPIVNMTAFESRGPQGGFSAGFHCPLDRMNINRVFPGNPEGTASHRIAYTLLYTVIKKCDYYMDFHGGDVCEELSEHVNIQKEDKIARELLAPSFNCEMVNIKTDSTSSIGAAFNILGKPALASEAGGYARLDETSVEFHVNGILNVLKRLKMIDGVPTETPEQKMRTRYLIGAKKGGLFYGVQLNTKVKKNQKIGEIKDVFGNVKYTINSPADGVIAFRRSIFPCSQGDRLFAIFPNVEPTTPPPALPYP